MNDYKIYSKKLNLNVQNIRNNCYIMQGMIMNNFGDGKGRKVYPAEKSTPTTELYVNYNLLLHPFSGFHELFVNIKDMFNHFKEDDDNYYLQSWLNVYKKGDYIDWHNHWDPKARAWHGFYCVSVPEPSSTLYKLPNIEEIIEIRSEENLLIMGKSDGDLHRSTENTSDEDRITIAFDIVPQEQINPYKLLNHWIPL